MAALDQPPPTAASAPTDGQDPHYWFALDDPEFPEFLQREGYVVVKGVASAEDVETAKSHVWSDLEGSMGVDRNDPSTWAKSQWRLPVHGLCAELSQTRGPWHIRGLPTVRHAFAQIWGTDQLITSMDAVIIWKPWYSAQKPDGENWKPRTEGLHLDQNPFSKPGLDCYQGMVPLCDVTEEIGGLQVVPRSHCDEAKEGFKRRHKGFRMLGDWCQLPKGDPDGEGAVLLCAEKGDLVLWDSRTIHGGIVGPGKSDEAEPSEPLDLARMTVTVAMTPREKASEDVQRVRVEGQAEGRSFNHCPHEAGVSSGTIHALRQPGFVEYELTEAQLEVL